MHTRHTHLWYKETLIGDGDCLSGWGCRCPRTLVRDKECFSAWHFQQKWPGTSQARRKHAETLCGYMEFSWFLMSCNSGTVWWEQLVPVSCCRAAQELLNDGWIMGISPSKPKRATFCARHFCECLRIAYTKLFTVELMDVSRLWDLNQWTVEELLYFLVSVRSPRSEGWPR